MKKKIVLFDMDGTLTEPRGPFFSELMISLRQIARYADIGILTGSDYNYIENQLMSIIRYSEIRFKLHVLPCNGTKYYKPPSYPQDDLELIFESNMSKELGERCLREIFKIISKSQAHTCYHNIPLTGHFINYRGSMINWCPIGRNADKEQRKDFIEYDKQNNFRKTQMKILQAKLQNTCPGKVVVKLGGDTSFDIYPTGWDKTYGLSHFKDWDCWFVGDRCSPGGNDYEIYEALKKEGRAFSVSDPLDTQRVIRDELLPKLEHP